ncbi:Bug family tripartite tricarboxylate transporter substrate binding protein [Elioraea sp.]|uniref:Bug family tripartite tricarboxylate transporter substrate binding protein n=1 Tax=Elioraea sp. TaxID=2185103 RepID=UPI003F72A6D4
MLRRLVVMALLALSVQPAIAQGSGPVRLVVGFPPGGAADVVARLVADQLRERLNITIAVENRPGAAGNIAAEHVARARPDGQTLLLASASTHGINPTLMARMPFDAERDFTPVSLVTMVPSILAVHAGLPVRTLREFIDYVKARPGQLNYGSVGNGTTQHLAGVLLKNRTGADMVHVPYRGQNLLIPALITGEIHATFNNIVAVQGGMEAGQLRGLAVAIDARWPTLPDVPTFAEAGLPDFRISSWLALMGPAGMPEAIAARYAEAMRAAVAEPALRQRLFETGNFPVGSTPAELKDFIAKEIASWGEVVRASGVRIE